MNSSSLEVNHSQNPCETHTLDLSNKNLIHTKGIEIFTNLVRLDLSNNSISELNGIDRLINLEVLDLSNNSIEVFGFYHSSNSATSIFIGKNRVVLPNSLKELYLDANGLFSTTEEWLDDNLLTPRIFPKLGLKKLSLKNNNFDTMESLSGIETIRGLEYLDLRDNRITNFGVLLACVPWGGSDNLTIRLEGNQFDEGQVDNLGQILNNFPQLNLHLDCLEESVSKLERVEYAPSIVTRASGLIMNDVTHAETVVNSEIPYESERAKTITNVEVPKLNLRLDTVETSDSLFESNCAMINQKCFTEESDDLLKKLEEWISKSNSNLANIVSE